MKTGERFWDAMSKSIVIPGILALAVWGAIIYLAVVQLIIPDGVMAGGALILGYFFGARSGQQTERVQAANAALRVRVQEVT